MHIFAAAASGIVIGRFVYTTWKRGRQPTWLLVGNLGLVGQLFLLKDEITLLISFFAAFVATALISMQLPEQSGDHGDEEDLLTAAQTREARASDGPEG
ncbi:hypothetical protein [Pseudactinotalea sp. HY158]|uniref:hypothetical protein n=1 Tax=Pseudactinotalea sp. HY158 TaxID=2654547 RepID=UPI00129CE38E|nr:hypothetical protein [Pseudactinotalea sp. HY158]QGH69135.1 hypothetical protein GCE65_06160 [Pseudactinotalea sp. HY158]